MGEGKHTDSTFGECFETLVQGCAAGGTSPSPTLGARGPMLGLVGGSDPSVEGSP
jgi:hypothetical protein